MLRKLLLLALAAAPLAALAADADPVRAVVSDAAKRKDMATAVTSSAQTLKAGSPYATQVAQASVAFLDGVPADAVLGILDGPDAGSTVKAYKLHTHEAVRAALAIAEALAALGPEMSAAKPGTRPSAVTRLLRAHGTLLREAQTMELNVDDSAREVGRAEADAFRKRHAAVLASMKALRALDGRKIAAIGG